MPHEEMVMIIKIPRFIKGPFKPFLQEFNPLTWREMRRHFRNGHYWLTGDGIFFPRLRIGWRGRFESWINDGLAYSLDKNLLCTEGANHVLDNGLNGATYYVGIYGGAVNPATTWTGSNVVSNSTETTNYDEAARPSWSDNAASSGSKTSSAASVFTATTAMTVNGAFLISVNTKGVAGGTLINAVRRSAEETIAAASTYNVSPSVTLTDT